MIQSEDLNEDFGVTKSRFGMMLNRLFIRENLTVWLN